MKAENTISLKTVRMFSAVAVLCSGVLFLPAAGQADPLTYTIWTYSPLAYSGTVTDVTGTITTDGNQGKLSTSDMLSATITFDTPSSRSTFSASSITVGAAGLTATTLDGVNVLEFVGFAPSQSLIVGSTTDPGRVTWKDLLSAVDPSTHQFVGGTYGANSFNITAVNGAATVDGSVLGTTPMVIASAVPEPGTLTLLGLAGLTGLATFLIRRRPIA
jgi:hypothetical protein